MIKVILSVSALLITSSGPEVVGPQRFEMKDIKTCVESASAWMLAAEETILATNSSMIGAAAICIAEYVKPPEGERKASD